MIGRRQNPDIPRLLLPGMRFDGFHTNDYGEYDGTRAFRGPRIPGRGVYFERLLAFPKKLRGGDRCETCKSELSPQAITTSSASSPPPSAADSDVTGLTCA